MIRLTEPTPCPWCRDLVIPGEEQWYDLLHDGTAGCVHICRWLPADDAGTDE